MQGWHLELVTNCPVDGLGFQEVVAVDRLRRSRIAVHLAGHLRGGYTGRMEERASPKALVRIGSTTAQQQRRAADRAGREQKMPRIYPDLVRTGSKAARVQRSALQSDHTI